MTHTAHGWVIKNGEINHEVSSYSSSAGDQSLLFLTWKFHYQGTYYNSKDVSKHCKMLRVIYRPSLTPSYLLCSSSNSKLNEFIDANWSHRVWGQNEPDWRQGHNDSSVVGLAAILNKSLWVWMGLNQGELTVWCCWLVGIISAGLIIVLDSTCGLQFHWSTLYALKGPGHTSRICVYAHIWTNTHMCTHNSLVSVVIVSLLDNPAAHAVYPIHKVCSIPLQEITCPSCGKAKSKQGWVEAECNPTERGVRHAPQVASWNWTSRDTAVIRHVLLPFEYPGTSPVATR